MVGSALGMLQRRTPGQYNNGLGPSGDGRLEKDTKVKMFRYSVLPHASLGREEVGKTIASIDRCD